MTLRYGLLTCVVLTSLFANAVGRAQGTSDNVPSVVALAIDVYDDNGALRFSRSWPDLTLVGVPQIGLEAGASILEGYLLDVQLTVKDPDLVTFTPSEPNQPATLERNDQEFFARKRSFPLFDDSELFFLGTRFDFGQGAPPNPPPLDLAFDTANFRAPQFLVIPPIDPNGLTDPTVPNDLAFISYFFDIPEYIGPAQARLAGQRVWDAAWAVTIEVTNAESVDNDDPRGIVSFDVYTIENPAFRPGNAPPFADAGANGAIVRDPATGIAAGTLDARASVDATNVGFDPANPFVFEKDTLTYSWELHSYPSDWTPNFTIEPFVDGSARALLQLFGARIGDVFEFRVVVRDGSNPTPSTAIVRVTVSGPVAANQAPVADAGDDLTVGVGGTITLDGRSSSDPDGDTLEFLWRQTNAVGGQLAQDQLDTAFQPVSGLTANVSTWRAVAIGTYYFRLIVSDPSGNSSFDDVVVVVSENGPTSSRTLGSSGDTAADSNPLGSLFGFGLCGAGLAPVAIVPLILIPLRRRFR